MRHSNYVGSVSRHLWYPIQLNTVVGWGSFPVMFSYVRLLECFKITPLEKSRCFMLSPGSFVSIQYKRRYVKKEAKRERKPEKGVSFVRHMRYYVYVSPNSIIHEDRDLTKPWRNLVSRALSVPLSRKDPGCGWSRESLYQITSHRW